MIGVLAAASRLLQAKRREACSRSGQRLAATRRTRSSRWMAWSQCPRQISATATADSLTPADPIMGVVIPPMSRLPGILGQNFEHGFAFAGEAMPRSNPNTRPEPLRGFALMPVGTNK